MKSLAELRDVKNKALQDMSVKTENGKRIVVGMATCGIAAGATQVMDAFSEAIAAKNIKDVTVVITGCIGVCKYEPLADVIDAKGQKVTYVHLDEEKVKRIVDEHIIGGEICSDLTMQAVEELEGKNA